MILHRKCSLCAHRAINYIACCSNDSVVNWDRRKRTTKKGFREARHRWTSGAVVKIVNELFISLSIFMALLQAGSTSQERPVKRAQGHFAPLWFLLRCFSTKYSILIYFKMLGIVYQIERLHSNTGFSETSAATQDFEFSSKNGLIFQIWAFKKIENMISVMSLNDNPILCSKKKSLLLLCLCCKCYSSSCYSYIL